MPVISNPVSGKKRNKLSNAVEYSVESSNLTSLEVKKSKEIYLKKILEIINATYKAKSPADYKRQLEKFKFYLGPFQELIQSLTNKDKDLETIFCNVKISCVSGIFDCASAAVSSYALAIRNESILATCSASITKLLKKQPTDKKLPFLQSDCDETINSHVQTKKEILTLGLGVYNQWNITNAEKINQIYVKTYLESVPPLFSDENIKLTEEAKSHIRKILIDLLTQQLVQLKWEDIYEQLGGQAYRIDDQIKLFYDKFVEELADATLSFNNLAEIIKYFEDKNTLINKLTKSVNKVEGNNSVILSKSVYDNFVSYVKSWFQIYSQIMVDRDNKSREEVLKNTIENFNIIPWQLEQTSVKEIFEAIDGITNSEIKKQFYSEFEKNYPTPQVQEAWDYSALLMIDSEQEKKPNSNKSAVLAKAIPKPLAWYQLKISLQHFESKTEAQLELKRILLAFVKDNFINNSADSLSLRRYIEYLFNCLCKANAEQSDEEILFNKFESPYTFRDYGINYVIGCLKGQQSDKFCDVLRNELNALDKKIKGKEVLYLKSAEDQPISLMDIIESKEILTPNDQYQLYWKYLNKSLHKKKLSDDDDFLDLRAACYYLTNAASLGHAGAQKRLLNQDTILLRHQARGAEQHELCSQLQLININSPEFKNAQFHLSSYYGLRLNFHLYEDYQERLADILLAYRHSNNVKALTLEHSLEAHVLDVLIKELSGERPIEKWFVERQNHQSKDENNGTEAEKSSDSPIFPFRLLPTRDFDKLLSKATLAEKAEIIQKIRENITKNITRRTCRVTDNNCVITIDKDIMADKKITCFIDKITGYEIARFYQKDGKIKFQAYGHDIKLKFTNTVVADEFILENLQGKILLIADFENKHLHIGAAVERLEYRGTKTSVQTLLLEATGSLVTASKSEITTNQFNIRAEDMDINGKIHTSEGGRLTIESNLKAGVNSQCTSDGWLMIRAGALDNTSAKFLAKKGMDIQTTDSIKVDGNGSVESETFFSLKARSIFTSDQSIIKSASGMRAEITNKLIIDRGSSWQAASFICSANIFDNNSPRLAFGDAQIRVNEALTNYADGVIKVERKLKISGGSLWNGGQIHYGDSCHAMMNKFFVNGLTDIHEIFGYRKRNNQPAIVGGDFTAVAGIYLDFFSSMRVRRLSQSALIKIDLGNVLLRTSQSRSCLIDLDLKIDLPNLSEVIKTLNVILHAGFNGDFEKIINNIDAYNSLTSFARWFLKLLIPQLSKVTDLVWSVLQAFIATPAFIAQLYSLYESNESLAKIELNRIIVLLTSTNSLAIQGFNIENQLQSISYDINNPMIQTAAAQSDTLLLDFAALFLPISSSSAFIKFESGFHGGFTSTDRSFLSYYDFDINVDLNITHMFESSVQENQLEIANNSSEIGGSLRHSGTSVSHLRSTNVTTQTESGHTVTSNLNDQANDFHSTQESKTEAKNARFSGDNQHFEGEYTTTNFSAQAKQAMTIDGNMQSEKTDLTAQEEIRHNSKSDVHDSKESQNSSLHESADNVRTESGSEISVQHLSQSGKNLNLKGNNDSESMAADAEEDLTVSGNNHVHNADLHSSNETHVSGSITGTGPRHATDNSETAPADILISGHNAQVDAVIAAEKSILEMLAAHDLQVSGLQKAATLQEYAGHNAVDDSVSIAHEKIVESNAEILFSGRAHFPQGMIGNVIELVGKKVEMASCSKIEGDGTAVIKADAATIRNIVISNLVTILNHINNIQDLLTTSGEYSSIKVLKGLYVKTNDDVHLNRAMNFVYSVGITANQIFINNNIHSDHDLELTSTVGDIRIGHWVVSAHDFLRIFSQHSFIGDKTTLSGRELFIHAVADVINNAGLWAGANYQEIVAGHDVRLNCYETSYQGAYDIMKNYDPAVIMGGAGVGHGGVGTVIKAGNKFYDTASKIISIGNNVIIAKQGFEITALIHRYISYHREYDNWIGTHSETTEYSYQIEQPVICSTNGSNTLLSQEGYARCVSALLVAAEQTYIGCKGNIQLLGYILNNEERKDHSSLFGVVDDQTDQIDDEALPTEVVSQKDIHIISEAGRVELLNAYVFTLGLLTIHGVDVLISAPILNHFFSETTRGLTISNPLQSLIDSQPVFQDLRSLANGHGLAEGAANLWNTFIDSKNFANVLSIAAKTNQLGNLALSMLSVQIGYAYSKTSLRYQTVANNVGLMAGDMDISADNSVTFNGGVSATANNVLHVKAPHVNQEGANEESSAENDSAYAGAGFSAMGGTPTGNASYSHSSQESTYHQNQHLKGKEVIIEASVEHEMKNANIEAEKVDITTPKQRIESETGTSTSQSDSVSAGTSGDVSFQHSSSGSKLVGEASGIKATELNENIGEQTLIGATIDAQHATGTVGHTTAQAVKEEKDSSSWGVNGNVNDLTKPTPPGSHNIPTVGVHRGQETYRGTQEAVVHVASGPNPSSANVTGKLDTSNDKGQRVTKDEHLDLNAKLPANKAAVSEIKECASSVLPSSHSPQIETASANRALKGDSDSGEENKSFRKSESSRSDGRSKDNSSERTTSSKKANQHKIGTDLPVVKQDFSLDTNSPDLSHMNEYAHESDKEDQDYTSVEEDSCQSVSGKESTALIFEAFRGSHSRDKDDSNYAYNERLKTRIFRYPGPDVIINPDDYVNGELFEGSVQYDPYDLDARIKPNRAPSLLDPYVVERYKDEFFVTPSFNIGSQGLGEGSDYTEYFENGFTDIDLISKSKVGGRLLEYIPFAKTLVEHSIWVEISYDTYKAASYMYEKSYSKVPPVTVELGMGIGLWAAGSFPVCIPVLLAVGLPYSISSPTFLNSARQLIKIQNSNKDAMEVEGHHPPRGGGFYGLGP